MSAEEDRAQSAFPPPPERFYKQFTEEAVKSGQIPAPPRIPKETYSAFGGSLEVNEDLIRPLGAQGIRQLFPSDSHDRVVQMKKLHQSLLVNFLDLLDVLIRSPSNPKREEKLNDINLLFVNLHHMINEFRPRQALEAVRTLMDSQRVQRDVAIAEFQRHTDTAKTILQQCSPFLEQLKQQPSSSSSSIKQEQEADDDQSLDTPMETDRPATIQPEASDCSEEILQLCEIADQVT